MNQPHSLRAIAFALIGFTCWVLGDMFMKLLGDMGIPKYQVMMFGGFGGMASIFIVASYRRQLARLKPRKPAALAILGLLFLMNYVIWLTALKRLPLANFYTVVFMAPTVGALFAALLLKEPLNPRKIAAIIVGFCGVIVAVNPAAVTSDKGAWLGYGVTFCGMLVIVTQMLTMRYIGHGENHENIAFYPRIAAIAGGLAALPFYGFEPMPVQGWLFCFATGAIGSMGWMFMAQAYKLAPAATVAPFHYSQIITGGVLGYLIWHNIPSAHLLIGAAIIIISGVYLVTHTRKSEKISKIIVDTP